MRHVIKRSALLALAAIAITTAGCGQPKVAPHNLRITMSLRTAVSARNAEWLHANADLIEQRRAEGEMEDEEYAAFQDILAIAREGNWEQAEAEVVRLQKAQRPGPDYASRAAHEHGS